MADYAVYFSPTHGTRACVRMVAEELGGGAVQEIDLTLPANRRQNHRFSGNDRAILGVPVYCGRIPPLPGLLDSLTGSGTPVLLVAVYGNRAWEDALSELKAKSAERGFHACGALAMLAPHCYVPQEVCPDRPDGIDRKNIAAFLKRLNWNSKRDLHLPGNTPWKPYPEFPFYPEAMEACTHCGVCEKVCPAEAVKGNQTDPERCLRCMACVQSCPSHARGIAHPAFAMVQQKLRMLAGVRKEVEVFPADECGA